MDIYEELKEKAVDLWEKHHLIAYHVQVKAETPLDDNGDPHVVEFPFQKGKEQLMEASINGYKGEAYTTQYGNFEGTLKEISEMSLINSYRRAIFAASLNVSLKSLNLISGTLHSHDKETQICVDHLNQHIHEAYGSVKITLVGFQSKMVEKLSAQFDLRVLDLDEDHIGKEYFGISVENLEKSQDAIAWADLLLVTGSTLVNGTLPMFLSHKNVLFYGTTIAGAAYLMGWDRICVNGN